MDSQKYDVIVNNETKIITVLSRGYIEYSNIISDLLESEVYRKSYTYRIIGNNFLIMYKDGKIISMYTTKDNKIIPIRFEIDEYINETLLKMKMINIRKFNHKTQKDVAEATSLSTQCISNLESIDSEQSPTLRSLNKYLNSLGYEMDIVPKK